MVKIRSGCYRLGREIGQIGLHPVHLVAWRARARRSMSGLEVQPMHLRLRDVARASKAAMFAGPTGPGPRFRPRFEVVGHLQEQVQRRPVAVGLEPLVDVSDPNWAWPGASHRKRALFAVFAVSQCSLHSAGQARNSWIRSSQIGRSRGSTAAIGPCRASPGRPPDRRSPPPLPPPSAG